MYQLIGVLSSISTLNGNNGYWQIKVNKADPENKAFTFLMDYISL